MSTTNQSQSNKAKLAPVVAVLNMKGGVGKTTISAHVFRVLFGLKQSGVLLIDLDPQFNLTQTILTKQDYEPLTRTNKTVLSMMECGPGTGLFSISTNGTPLPSIDEIGKHLKYIRLAPNERLTLIPGDFRLVKYSLMDNHVQLQAVKKRFSDSLELMRTRYRVVCIDCNPSSSFLTMCALQACTHVIVPVRPDKYSVLGLELLHQFISTVPLHPKPKFVVVMNGMSRSKGINPIESELRAHSIFGGSVIPSKLYHSTRLAASSGYTGFATDKKGPWKNVTAAELSAVASDLARELGLQ